MQFPSSPMGGASGAGTRRDTMEQMLAAAIVAAHHSALDCLSQAAETEDPTKAELLRRSRTTMTRTMGDTIRLLGRRQQRPADTQAPPARRAQSNALPPIKRESLVRADERSV